MTDLDLAAVEAAAAPQALAIAEKIAAGARANYRFRALKTNDPKIGVIAEPTAFGARVITYNSFAHWDEWGTVTLKPSGAMRSAAARVGLFRPSPKPS